MKTTFIQYKTKPEVMIDTYDSAHMKAETSAVAEYPNETGSTVSP